MAEKQSDRVLATLADYQRTFETAHGKRVLRRMMKECMFQIPSYVPGDSHGTAFNEGKRAAVLEIIDRLKWDLRQLEEELRKQEEAVVGEDYID